MSNVIARPGVSEHALHRNTSLNDRGLQPHASWQSGSNVGGLVGMAKSSASNAPANGTAKLSVIEKSPNYLFHQ
jgi:hypothetical protein